MQTNVSFGGHCPPYFDMSTGEEGMAMITAARERESMCVVVMSYSVQKQSLIQEQAGPAFGRLFQVGRRYWLIA